MNRFYEYQESKRVSALDAGFHSLIFAAFRKADSGNTARLRAAFPELYDELVARYNAPGGVLPTDQMKEHTA